MRMSGSVRFSLLSVFVALAATLSALAFVPKKPATSLDERQFRKPDLHISTSNVPLEELRAGLGNAPAWNRFLQEYGDDFHAWIDPRSGAATNIQGHVPLIPGRGVGNKLSLDDVSRALGRNVSRVDGDVVAAAVRAFVERNADVLALDKAQLGAIRADQVSDDVWQVSVPQQVNGIPVRWGRLAATINHGNLVVIGTENWGNVAISTTPALDADDALKIGFEYAGGTSLDDRLWAKPQLEIVPFAPAAQQSGESFAGSVGSGYGHRLAWTFGFVREGQTGSWQVTVDAQTGEILEFQDVNAYEKKKVVGGIYPVTCTEICPDAARCGTMQPGSPMPWTDTGFPAPADLTNSAGLYDYPGGTATTTLAGKYVLIGDECGTVNQSSATGDIDMGGVNGEHDCTGIGSAGNTPSSRSAFYEVNKLVELARGWLPNNSWLQTQIPTNVNINDTCNAFYSPYEGSINFYKSGGGCRNTGEIAAVFDHEWGHGLDDNDSGGSLSTTSETYADIAAIYRLQMSCVGYGFWWTVDQGCGLTLDGTGYNGDNADTGGHLCELDCSGVRGADYQKHEGGIPDSPASFSCPRCDSGSGPCGREVHCDARPATEAAWDLAARDLQSPPFNYDSTTAFMIANRLFYQGSGNVGNWHACSCPSTSDGCGSTNAYTQWLTVDDDNGNLNDGTPHMTALHAAFDRHGIACASPAPVNSGCAGAPAVAPVLTAAAASNQVVLSWNAVPSASKYWVLRSEGFAGCDFGKALIATVTGTTYTDADTANGRTYSYNVVAVGASNSCFSPASACVQATPQPCAGSIALDRSLYNCSDNVQISLTDIDLLGNGTHDVVAWSGAEATPETITLLENPPASGHFAGSVPTTASGAAHGDGLLSVAHGDTISVRYVDASYCGTPDVPVTQTAAVDCVAPAISGVFADNVTGSQAQVHWSTDEISTSVVHYGRTIPPGSLSSDPALVTDHLRQLEQLPECSLHYYSVESADAAGNTALDDNGGAYYTFRTPKNVNPSYASSDTPVPIPDNAPAGASSTIVLADTNTVLDVNVTVDIAHTYDGDISLYLVGPNGTTVTLSQRHGGSGDNYTGTTFDDSATTPIASGTSPYRGTFQPDTPLASLDGIPATGSWTLQVVDSAGGDSGTIVGWTLTLLYPAEDCGATLRLDADAYSCSATAGISVKDTTLAGAPSLTVAVGSGNETTPEIVTLVAQPAPHEDTFLGSIGLTTGAPAHGDGLLSVADGDTVSVTYIDADDGQGGHDIPHTDAAAVDCVRPVITSVTASDVTDSSALISWVTNEDASSTVRYDVTTPPGSTTSDPALVTAHHLLLTGLAECSTYSYAVESSDAVGNTVADDNAGNYFTFETGRHQTVGYPSSDTPLPIPDSTPSGVASTIIVADSGPVQDVNVIVNITHTYDGDLSIYLVGPNGVSVQLSNRRGSSGDNFTGTVFDDQAATPIASGSAPFSGSFRPDAPLSALNGIGAAGSWQLKVVDNAGSDTGSIVDWTLQVTYPSGSCGADASYLSSAGQDSCLAGGTHSDDGVVDRGEDVVLPVVLRNSGTVPLTGISATISTTLPGVTVTRASATYPDMAAGASASSLAPHFAYTVGPTVPCGTEIPFGLAIVTAEGSFLDSFTALVGAPGSATNTYTASDLPKPIPDNTTVTSTVTVTDTSLVQDVNVVLSLTHTFDGDLTLTLIGPNGVRVVLSNRRGSSGDNFTGTTFDDQATTPIASGSAPFSGSYRPDEPLSGLNGIPANGAWQLEVKDNAGGDTGTLTAWQLVLTSALGFVCNDCVTAVPSTEVGGVAWTGKLEQRWDTVAGSSFYNVYRGDGGTLPDLLTPAVESCLRLSTTGTATGPVLDELPVSGGAYWYLVRAANSAGEGPAGNASTGPRNQQSDGPCP
ncbi:MAG: proprotein convertase P-domain-containing protein [Acidobacteria bacterium]|nr:proprotein convertase P-domain-containing protein [Acidobacteriota bacterium]